MNTENLQSISKQRYYDQQLLTVEDFQREQNFHIAYRQLQNQLLLKPGILTGLTVQAGVTQGQVQIMPGVAIDNSGHLINLTNTAKFNDANILVQSSQFLLDLSDQQYQNKTWLLILEYNQEEDPNSPNQWKEIPKFVLIPSTNGANYDQIALATLNVTTSQTGATLSISIETNLSIRVNAVIAPECIPNLEASKITTGLLNIAQIPNLPASKVDGSLATEQIPEISAEKITSGVFDIQQIPSIPTSKLTGKLGINQMPDIQNIAATNLNLSDSLTVSGTSFLNGNVGIGTTDLRNSRFKILANSSNSPDFMDVRFANPGAGQLEILGWTNGWNISVKKPGIHLYLNRDADNTSDLYMGCGGKELFVKGSTGNVGIGTTTPSDKLEVSGDIRATNLNLTGRLTVSSIETHSINVNGTPSPIYQRFVYGFSGNQQVLTFGKDDPWREIAKTYGPFVYATPNVPNGYLRKWRLNCVYWDENAANTNIEIKLCDMSGKDIALFVLPQVAGGWGWNAQNYSNWFQFGAGTQNEIFKEHGIWYVRLNSKAAYKNSGQVWSIILESYNFKI